MQTPTQRGNLFLFVAVLLCGMLLDPRYAFADGTPTIPATQAEVNAGVIHNKYVSPDTLAGWTGGGGGSTNGLTSAQFQASLASRTNRYDGVFTNSKATIKLDGTGFFSDNTITFDSSGTFTAVTLSAATITAATMWATNMVTPTNNFAATIIDFGKAESRTNLGGNLTFTGVANITSGAMNSCILTLAANGADRTIVFPAGFHIGRGSTLVVTNGTEAEFLIRLAPGIRTNVYQLDSI